MSMWMSMLRLMHCQTPDRQSLGRPDSYIELIFVLIEVRLCISFFFFVFLLFVFLPTWCQSPFTSHAPDVWTTYRTRTELTEPEIHTKYLRCVCAQFDSISITISFAHQCTHKSINWTDLGTRMQLVIFPNSTVSTPPNVAMTQWKILWRRLQSDIIKRERSWSVYLI